MTNKYAVRFKFSDGMSHHHEGVESAEEFLIIGRPIADLPVNDRRQKIDILPYYAKDGSLRYVNLYENLWDASVYGRQECNAMKRRAIYQIMFISGPADSRVLSFERLEEIVSGGHIIREGTRSVVSALKANARITIDRILNTVKQS